ncbi:fungal-specific transcription factor domain-containing protein [Hypoxylon sp. FL1150]|nr:fungal-specific transcription factor domain-containing protein [Hypoxylon sp. FL1150]
MFTTFPVPSTASSRPIPNHNPNPSSASPIATQPPRTRQKRSQVIRACEWCRTHRIKCDDNYPCMNCHARGGQCSNDRTSGIRTLPQAFREIERLRQRHRELQEELEEERNRNKNQTELLLVSSGSQLSNPSATSGLLRSPIVGSSNPGADGGGSSQKYWEGVYIRIPKSPTKTWYGPSSLLYFISRLTVFLSSKLWQYQPEYCTQSSSVPNQPDEPPNTSEKLADENDPSAPNDPMDHREWLTPTQEEYFLDFYWQSYHTSLPVLNENDFKRHYRSLWAGSRRIRKSSALVDIVIALCMQYGVARARSNSASSKVVDIDISDAALAGRWYYCRCQTILAYDLESPTISTLQCNILSVIWLCYASLQNIADNTLALTARTAHRIGLHLPPPQDVSPRESELRKRLWWSVYVLETKISMKLGRPFLLHASRMSGGLPGDDHEAATLSGSNFAPLGDHATWLSWNVYNTKLVLAVRNVYTAFYDEFPDIFNGDSDQTIYDTPTALESYASFLLIQMKTLEYWVNDVPGVLKTKRRNHGNPYSTDFSPLDIEQFAPVWVQNQRFLLELLYHNFCTNLYRPFISVEPISTSSTSTSPKLSSNYSSSVECCASRCANHAMAATFIMQQVLSTTDILNGWHEAFQWQWNCAMTLIGFVIAYPNGELTQIVRQSIRASLEVLESFGHSLAIAASAASIVRELSEALGHTVVSNKTENKIGFGVELTSITPQDADQAESIGTEEESVTDIRDILSASMEMAFAVDGYNTSNMWWPGVAPAEV